MKRFISTFMSLLFFTQILTNAYAFSDARILLDPIANVYTGRAEAIDMITNLDFEDISSTHWAKESVVRAGALNIIKAEGRNYYPNQVVSKQDAITFIIRALGRENEAVQAAANLGNTLPAGLSLADQLAVGSLSVASGLGIISVADFNNSLTSDPQTLDATTTFVRTAPATREEVASWLVRGLTSVNANAFESIQSQQTVYTYLDWTNIDVTRLQDVEAVAASRIMIGNTSGNFNPKGTLTRAEMAQVIKNMDSIYFGLVGIQKIEGTVGAVFDSQASNTNQAHLTRGVYVRNYNGNVDKLEYSMIDSSSPQDVGADAVVFKNSNVTGLVSLAVGDKVEYLVDNTNNVLYVNVLSSEPELRYNEGRLDDVNVELGTITIRDNQNKMYTYPLNYGLYGTNNDNEDYLYINIKRVTRSDFPMGANVRLSLVNNIVDAISFVGEEPVVSEFRGIVIENNPQFGYLVVRDNNANQRTMNYTDNDIIVEKTQHYHNDDNIGYYNQLFPNFNYDPRSTTITNVEAGDIVFIRPYADDANVIREISASTNYIMHHGKILQLNMQADVTSILIEYENKQTQWFELSNNIFVSKDGKPINVGQIKIGDWAKVLINQAIIGPGHVMESIKEITIEGDEHFISNIVRGQLTLLNAIQNKIVIQNAQTLNKTGWANYKNLQEYYIDGRDMEFYNNGERISFEFAERYLKRANGEVYIALENNFAGEKVKKVTFRDGRDELLKPDVILNSNGVNGFSIISNNGLIQTDSGTIVRRHGRLVGGSNITAADYAVVSLNGGNRAAVVDIVDAPDTSGIIVVRGRIQSVDDGKSFTVQSMAILSGNTWVYTPVQREFRIDYNTLFLNENGYVNSSTFLGYTENSVIDNVYDIIVDGTTATHVVQNPFSQLSVRGTIYEINSNVVSLKDVTVLNNDTGAWDVISNVNNTAKVTIPLNSVVIKNNNIGTNSNLQVGDRIKVMTDKLPDRLVSGINIDGYIVHVEN